MLRFIGLRALVGSRSPNFWGVRKQRIIIIAGPPWGVSPYL